MSLLSAISSGRAALPATENAVSLRYLRMLERWLPFGVAQFAPWPDRPNCGHFFGGCHWYGTDTAGPAYACAVAAASPAYDERASGLSRTELRAMAAAGVRYLCFTHDTGPPDCLRPKVGRGRPETWGNKWGERGHGFFNESQCGNTVARLAKTALLLRDDLDAETWELLARVQLDYAERFGGMAPRNGVYRDTQMEENDWTAYGLTAVALFLEAHPQAPAWYQQARRWMLAACAAPQDTNDFGQLGELTVRELARRNLTALPDYWAENHGFVHPSYTATGVQSLATTGGMLGLWGRELPPELYFNRQRIYENLKALTDGSGRPQAVQGMDWPYLRPVGFELPHAVAAVFFADPDAAALQRRGLRAAELRQQANGGRFYEPEVADRVHDQQDPLVMRESQIFTVADLYLLHRLFGPGPEPTPEAELERRLAGVRLFPHAGFVHHRHDGGQTSVSWRNSIMALPLPAGGSHTIAPHTNSWLGRPVVRGKPDSQHLRFANVSRYDAGFALALAVDRCQGTLRQEALVASLPDGRFLSHERFRAVEAITVETLDQGLLGIINERFPLLGDNSRGARLLYHAGGATEYRGWLGDRAEQDQLDRYERPGWLNVDDQLGVRFQASGSAVYHNRHLFQPYRAIADDLVLSRLDGPQELRAGQVAGWLAALLCPNQPHAETPATALLLPESDPDTLCLACSDYLAVANLAPERRHCSLRLDRPADVPVYADCRVELDAAMRITIALEAESAALLPAVTTLQVDGDVRLDGAFSGAIYATNLGTTAARLTEAADRPPRHLQPKEVQRL